MLLVYILIIANLILMWPISLTSAGTRSEQDSNMTDPYELLMQAAELFEKGPEHHAEAHAIVHKLVFGDEPSDGSEDAAMSAGPLADDEDALLMGLAHGTWDNKDVHFNTVCLRATLQLSTESISDGPGSWFALPDRLNGMGYPEAALKVLPFSPFPEEAENVYERRRALYLYELDRDTAAIAAAWKSLQLDPSDAISHRVYAQMAERNGLNDLAFMAQVYAIAIEPYPEMVVPMLGELMLRTYWLSNSTTRYPRIESIFRGVLAEKETTDANRYRIDQVRSIVRGIGSVAVVEMNEDPNLKRSLADPFTFYLPFFALLHDAGLVNAFVDHLYRTTSVSDAPEYDPDDRFGVLRYAKR